MTRQEEIDWGLRELCAKWTGEDGTKYVYDFSLAIRQYLSSQGVVIRAESGVVMGIVGDDGRETRYFPVEPLIKED